MSLSKFDLKPPPKPSRYPELVDELSEKLRQARVVADRGGSLTALDPLVREWADIFTNGRAEWARELMKFFKPVSNDNTSSFHMQVGKELEKAT